MDKVLSEVYTGVIAMGKEYINRIPADVWEDIIAKKNDDYNPYVDVNKPLGEQGFAEETITFIAMLYRDYWCDTEEEKTSLLGIFEKNQAEWDTKLSKVGSVRGLLRMVHKN